jgi:hypothetical protein
MLSVRQKIHRHDRQMDSSDFVPKPSPSAESEVAAGALSRAAAQVGGSVGSAGGCGLVDKGATRL